MKKAKDYELQITDRRRRLLSAALLRFCILIFLFSTTGFGATVAEYRGKIREARESLDILIYSDEEESNQGENLKSEREILKDIRAALPASETVETGHGSVEVKNDWLLDKLNQFENEKDPVKRTEILSEASDRAGAVEAKLLELEEAVAAERTKDEDKQKLAEILRRAEYQKKEEKQESFFHKVWRGFLKWMDRMFPEPNLGAPSKTGFQSFSFVLQLIIFALVAAIVGFLMYRFLPFLSARFKQREKKDTGERVVLGERLAADETSFNLFAEAEKLAGEGNLRAAIRKGYIALLCELSDRKIIGLAQHKTNRDYLRDVRSRTELYQNMNGLTGSFERHWYGFAAPEEKDWEAFREKYRKTISG
jgi:hypothetical protein